MECLPKIFVLTLVLGMVGSALSRVYIFDDGRSEQRVQRSKRQIPATHGYIFSQNIAPIHEREVTRRVKPRALRQSLEIQNTPWELGYDPSEILNPPGLEPAETQYRTLRVYKRSRPETENSPAIIWGTLKKGAVVNRPQRSSLEGTPALPPAKRQEQDEEDEEEEEEDGSGYSQEGHSYHHVPASIYSFVKTDPHGNFKWGVHRGAPVRG